MADIGKFFGSLIGGAASPASGIIDGAKGIIGMFKLDPTLKAQLEQQLTLANLDMEKTELAGQISAMQGQLEINKQEAASTSTWVAGWRPFIGWICGCALGWEFVLKPFFQFFLIAIHHPPLQPLPVLDTASLIAGLLAPMLGLGTMRSVEKIQGADGSAKLQ